MRNAFSVCRECCGCERSNANSQYTVCDGQWTVDETGFTTSDSNARLLFNPTVGTAPFRASVDVIVTALTNPSWTTRIIGGASSCLDGRWFEWGNSAAGNYIGLEGTRQPWSDTCIAGLTVAGTYTRKLALCYDGATLSGGHVAGQALLAKAISVPGGRFGFSTGTLTNVSSVRFANPTLEYGESIARPTCPECGFHCCHGPVPPSLILEISGVPSYLAGFPSGPFTSCLVDCMSLNGTRVLSAVGDSGSGFTAGCAGDRHCAWSSSYTTTLTCGGFPPTSGPTTVAIQAGAVALSNGTISVSASFSLVSGPPLATFSGVTSTPCIDWGDWIPLTHVVNQTQCALGTSYMARIKAA